MIYALAVLIGLAVNFATQQFFLGTIAAGVCRGVMSGIIGGQVAWWITCLFPRLNKREVSHDRP